MVIFGGWRRRRRSRYEGGYGNQYGYGPGYGGPPRWYGRGPARGSSLMRDVCLIESGCCLAEAIGCGPQLALLTPSLLLHPPGRTAAQITGDALPGVANRLSDRVVRTLVGWIRVYQQEISPRRGACCRYTPSCSEYGAQALQRHGFRRGISLTAGRLIRCRPGTVGGPDPAPA